TSSAPSCPCPSPHTGTLATLKQHLARPAATPFEFPARRLTKSTSQERNRLRNRHVGREKRPGREQPARREKVMTSTTKKRPRCKPRPGQLPWRQAASSTRMQAASRNRTQAGRDPKLPNPPTAGSTSFGWNSRALRG